MTLPDSPPEYHLIRRTTTALLVAQLNHQYYYEKLKGPDDRKIDGLFVVLLVQPRDE